MSFVFAYLTTFIVAHVYSGITDYDLLDLESPTRIAFYDFDRTIMVESFGCKVQVQCIQQNISAFCNGTDELITALYTFADPDRILTAFGGETRLARLKAHFTAMTREASSIEYESEHGEEHAQLYILSTSCEPIPPLEWEKMIEGVLEYGGLTEFFPREHILGLPDLGVGIQSDKGAKAKEVLDALGITDMAECIFADDKEGNLNFADCEGVDYWGVSCDEYGGDREICQTLLIQERAGMDYTDFNYYEARTVLPVECSDSDSDSDDSAVFGAHSLHAQSNDSRAIEWAKHYSETHGHLQQKPRENSQNMVVSLAENIVVSMWALFALVIITVAVSCTICHIWNRKNRTKLERLSSTSMQ